MLVNNDISRGIYTWNLATVDGARLLFWDKFLDGMADDLTSRGGLEIKERETLTRIFSIIEPIRGGFPKYK